MSDESLKIGEHVLEPETGASIARRMTLFKQAFDETSLLECVVKLSRAVDALRLGRDHQQGHLCVEEEASPESWNHFRQGQLESLAAMILNALEGRERVKRRELRQRIVQHSSPVMLQEQAAALVPPSSTAEPLFVRREDHGLNLAGARRCTGCRLLFMLPGGVPILYRQGRVEWFCCPEHEVQYREAQREELDHKGRVSP